MAQTTNLGLDLQATGSNVNTWGADLNSAVFTIIDNAMGGVQTLSFSSSNVTVTQTQTQNNLLLLTGTLTANVNMIFPAIGRTFWVQNNCTGNFTLTAMITGSSGAVIAIPQMYGGSPMPLILDGVNCYAGQGYVPPGEIIYTSSPNTPFGYIPANGAAVSRTAFPALNAQASAAGYAAPWGPGDGSTTFNVISVRGYFLRALDDGAGIDPGRVFGSTQAFAVQSHTHGVNDGGHAHTVSTRAGDGTSNNSVSAFATNNSTVVNFSTGSSLTGISIQNTGSTETRPVNIAFRAYIRA